MTTIAERLAASERQEVAVLRAVIEWFRSGDHFTSEVYYIDADDGGSGPGPQVVQTCAIGGVEQAVWLILGSDVRSSYRELAYSSTEHEVAPDGAPSVYGRVMGRLNRIAREMYGDLALPGFEVLNIEHVTFGAAVPPVLDEGEVVFQQMMTVFEAALAELEGSPAVDA